jgi:hypothetical protein
VAFEAEPADWTFDLGERTLTLAVEAPDPALVALVSGDPWMAVWFAQAAQLAALRAAAPPRAGTCFACGRPLVRAGGRTYHPAADLPRGVECAALLPIPGTRYHSFDVEPAAWVP